MTLQTNTVKISGVPGNLGWSQSFEYVLDETTKSNISLLVIVFSTINQNAEMNDAVLGRELLNEFREEYFSDTGKNPENSLKDSVRRVFNDFFQRLDGLEIAAACFTDNNLFTASINGGKVSLYRDNFLVKILDSNTPQLVSASGYPKENDILVLATSDFYKNMTFSEIKDMFPKGMEAVKDYFSMKLHDHPTASVALIEFTKPSFAKKLAGAVVSESGEVPLRRERREIKSFFQDTIKFVGNVRLRLPRRRIYLHQDRLQEPVVKSKKTMYLGVFLTLLLGVSVIFGIYKNRKDAYVNSYATILNDAKSNIETAVSLKGVDVSRSREALLKGKELLSKLTEDQIKDPQIDELKKVVSDNEGEILGERNIDSEMWLDLTLILDGFNSDKVVFSDGLVYVFDASKSRIIKIDLLSKKSETIKVTDVIEGAEDFSVRSDKIYFLTGGGVYENTAKAKVIDKNWDDAKRFSLYSSNIYILDQGKGQILKTSGTDTGFSQTKQWTTSDGENFNGTKSFVVDGFAWVLGDLQIKKYSYGNNIKFETKGYPYELPKYDILYTDEESENLYLLSKEKKVISVFSKDGEYKYNLNSDIISGTKDLVISESDGKIILLTGEKLYEIKI